MKQSLTPKQKIFMTLAAFGVIAMGFVYVFVGDNILQRVPKTEVTQAESQEVRPLTATQPSDTPAQAELAPQPLPAPQVQVPAPPSPAPAPSAPANTGNKPSNGSSVEKKLRKLVSLLPGPRE